MNLKLQNMHGGILLSRFQQIINEHSVNIRNILNDYQELDNKEKLKKEIYEFILKSELSENDLS